MAKHTDANLPDLVSKIRWETDRMIRAFDETFLRSCGIAPEPDIEGILRGTNPPNRGPARRS